MSITLDALMDSLRTYETTNGRPPEEIVLHPADYYNIYIELSSIQPSGMTMLNGIVVVVDTAKDRGSITLNPINLPLHHQGVSFQ